MLATNPPRRSRTTSSTSGSNIVAHTAAQTASETALPTADDEVHVCHEIAVVSRETSRSSRQSSMSAINVSPTSPYAAIAAASISTHPITSRSNSSASTLGRRTVSQLSNEIIAETPEPPNAYSSLLASSLAAAQPTLDPTQPSQIPSRTVPYAAQPSTAAPPNQTTSDVSATRTSHAGSASLRTGCPCCIAPTRKVLLKVFILIVFVISTAATVFQWTRNQVSHVWSITRWWWLRLSVDPSFEHSFWH